MTGLECIHIPGSTDVGNILLGSCDQMCRYVSTYLVRRFDVT
jgi:hypothetical protein